MKEEYSLYSFEKLCNTLKISKKSQIWTEITKELTIEEQLHNIKFTTEGVIYTDKNGNEWLGYVYKKYKALGNGKKDNYPRMHLCHCGVTDTWGKAPYMFSNTIPIECYDTSNKNQLKIIPNIIMCKNCIPIRKNKGWNNYRDAKQYVKYIRNNYDLEDSQIVNRWGFTQDWQAIRERTITNNYFTCQQCGKHLDSVIGRTFLHVYHIDRDMANNNNINLRCLCTRCYLNSIGVTQTDALKKQLYAYEVYLGEKAWIKDDDKLPSFGINKGQTTPKKKKIFAVELDLFKDW